MDSEYLKASKKIPLISTFWHSPEYFKRAGWIETEKNGVMTVQDVDGNPMFPSITKEPLARFNNGEEVIWAAIEDPLFGFKAVFLDYNYIYNPLAFDYIEGSMWKLWRKNLRRFETNHSLKVEDLEYRFFQENEQDKIKTLFVKWLDEQDADSIIHDDEVMVEWILNPNLKNTKGLFINEKLISFNIWDFGYEFINYRYSIGDPKIPFVNYKVRELFYKDKHIRDYGMLINDGGVLDNPKLTFFKNHLNPVMKLKINSWRNV